ncbi:hypothetical protein SAMN05216319_5354 [Duganella sp. CF402]|uniref:hypothetical protein n=1 Tax=unclassified Duganella TaxID=2636909 RepID=UPI0008CB9FAF|nr:MULTISPECIES: hypothetical protein [unclassified Duganella]RZT05354.1 hypothetical protein EV582_3665 [Duganella sp. BK701]SEN10925.1 hypothetical protein SAMN05216319_5354 [Duganella sp. CF402]
MTKHQGGASTSQAMSVNVPAGRRTKPRPGRFSQLEIPAAISNIGQKLSDRKVREIVTVSGRGVRGRFPSYKGKLLNFESLIEEDALRVLNVASVVTSLVTQPCVFAIPGSPHLRYTPDLRATMYGRDYFVEIKPADFQKNSHVATRLRRVISHFKISQTPFLLILDTDLRSAGLQEELKALLRLRPAPGRYDPTLDSIQWDPRQTQTAPPALLHRWYAAQRECDALLQRVMRRDPDALFEHI